MQIELVPLDKLHFGHECPEGNINSRRTDRDHDVPKLAASIATFGLLLPLLTKTVGGKIYVAAGNKRLAAIRHIFDPEVHTFDGGIIDKDAIPTVDLAEADGLEVSLVENDVREPLHQVDKFETFSALRDDCGLTVHQIAQRHGISFNDVTRALALGSLSPKVRDAWRKGEINADGAKAFTLADTGRQDKVLVALRKQHGDDGIDVYHVRQALGSQQDSAAAKYVNFVGAEAYEVFGGKLTRDLFGGNHIVHDPKIAIDLASRKLSDLCDEACRRGWKWALTEFDAPKNAALTWQRLPAEQKPTKEQTKRIEELESFIDSGGDAQDELREARISREELENDIAEAAYKPTSRSRAGCILSVSDDGGLRMTCGLVQPQDEIAERKESKKAAKDAAPSAASDPKPAAKAEPSGALLNRLRQQEAEATKAALLAEAREVKADNLFTVLVKMTASMIQPGRMNWTSPELQNAMVVIRREISPKIMNEALRKAFDEADYFASAPKAVIVKMIKECTPGRLEAGLEDKPKAELTKAALALFKKEKWLPPEIRTVHYSGPGSKKKTRS